MAKMNGLLIISLLVLLVSHPIHCRSIRDGLDHQALSDGENHPESKPSFLEWGSSSTIATESCEPTYGILPCSSNVWGLFFLIVVYEILLSFGGKYVGIGSELFFKAIGPDHQFGASLFQFLGTVPQIALVLGTSFTGSVEGAQQRATMGMGLVAGTTAMLLTFLWGFSVVLGSDNLSEAHNPAESAAGKWRIRPNFKGIGVTTDAETSYTARLIWATLIPFLILLFAKVFNSTSGRSWIILIALLVTLILLIAYVFYQTFQPWIRHRRFEHLMDTYAQDKIVNLFEKNGKPDEQKMEDLFNKIDMDHDRLLSPGELKVWLFGVDVDADNLSVERDVESILRKFDKDGNDLINEKEFVEGMKYIVSRRCKHIPDRLKHSKNTNSQNNDESQKGLISIDSGKTGTVRSPKATHYWWDYVKAIFYLTFGIVILCAMAEPLTKSVVGFSQAANLSSFWVSYLAIPIATNYGVVCDTFDSAVHKTRMAISLTLSTLYSAVFMNNIIGLIVFLAPVYARNLSVDVFRDVVVVLIICIVMTWLTSFRTTFRRWMGWAVLLLYPLSLALVYVLNSVCVGL